MPGLPTLRSFEDLARLPALRRALYPAAFVLAFVLFLFGTFPYDTLARRLENEARAAGAELTLGRLTWSGFFGLRAYDVKLRLPQTPGAEPLPELRFERADLSPDLLPLLLRRVSFGFAVQAYGGKAHGHAALGKDPAAPGLSSLDVDAKELDLARLPLRDLAGVQASGRARLEVALASMIPAETTHGTLSFEVDSAAVQGGSAMGVPIPKAALGKLELHVNVEKGMAKVERSTARGGDLDLDAEGTVKLRPLFSLSQADLHVRLRPNDRWLNDPANGLIKAGLGMAPPDARQSDGGYAFTLTGPLAQLSSRPGR